MLDDMMRRIAAFGPQPDDMNEEGALAELLSSHDLYTQEPKHLAEYDYEKLKVVRRAFQPLDAALRLPAEARALLDNFHVHIERSEAEMEVVRADSEVPRPYWDPRPRSSRPE
eukprot:9166223-Heterocapsa_arctica.AAC.1